MSVAKRMSNISLEDNFSISSVLSAIPTKALIDLYLADNRGVERNENWKKNDLKKMIVPSITSSAVKFLVENMTTEQLKVAIEPLHINHEKKRNNPNSRKVLSKRFTEALTQTGIAEYLEKHAELDLLKGIAEGLELTAKSNKSDLINAITEAAEAEGLRVFFESFSEELLRDVAFDMKLEKDPLATPSKALLIECILHNQEVPEKQKKKKEKIKFSKSKPSIKKGVTYQDLFQHYNVDELHDWCKKSGLKTSGAKPDLIRRILAFLDGEKENIMAGQRKAPKRRKSTVPKKKKATPKKEETEEAEDEEEEVEEAPKKDTKKEAAKKETTKKASPAPTKKASPPPKQEESEDEAEDEVEDEVEEEGEQEEEGADLDLDNLESHSVAELKKYCEEEEIEVKGTKKNDYIQAILAYNDEEEEN